MNWDQVEGKWKEVRGKAQTQWGKLSDTNFCIWPIAEVGLTTPFD